jgi:very-short-patch-repair endonuclease
MSRSGQPRGAMLERIREALADVLAEGTWNEIEQNHRRVSLPWRPDLEPGSGKPKYLQKVLFELSDDDLVGLAQRCLETFPEQSGHRLQDALWWFEAEGVARLSGVTRQALAKAVDGRRLHPELAPYEVMGRFSKSSPVARFEYRGQSLVVHAHGPLDLLSSKPPREAQPTNHQALFAAYGLDGWPDARVHQLVEYLVHPEVRQGSEQAEWVQALNAVLAADGYHLAETAALSGHPVYSVECIQAGVDGRPKNLIFASTGPKPELGFRDAINNDIEILAHAEHCLIYSDPIPDDGLRWGRLVAWWAAHTAADPAAGATRRALAHRLHAALGSPPERFFFESYLRTFIGELGDELPALIPQVYLHYDPVTVKELRRRGQGNRYEVQRMDFLLLLPHRVRVVLEVDGQQHYSLGEGEDARPSPSTYAKTVRGDRQLRLAGYEVYRFGGHELFTKEAAESVVKEFFTKLFQRHRVRRSAP